MKDRLFLNLLGKVFATLFQKYTFDRVRQSANRYSSTMLIILFYIKPLISMKMKANMSPYTLKDSIMLVFSKSTLMDQFRICLGFGLFTFFDQGLKFLNDRIQTGAIVKYERGLLAHFQVIIVKLVLVVATLRLILL
jgi:hypothetical protein